MNASLGDLEFSEKSKKEKVRSLSAVAKALSMGCRVSHSQKPTKKFKLPIKVPPLVLVLVSYALFSIPGLCLRNVFFFNI